MKEYHDTEQEVREEGYLEGKEIADAIYNRAMEEEKELQKH